MGWADPTSSVPPLLPSRGFTILELVAASTEDTPSSPTWLTKHLLLAPASDWGRDAEARKTLLRRLGIAIPPGLLMRSNPTGPVLEGLLRDEGLLALRATFNQELMDRGPLNLDGANSVQRAFPGIKTEELDRDTALRFNRTQVDNLAQQAANQSALPERVGPPHREEQPAVTLGPLFLRWLRGGRQDQLVAARQIQVGNKRAFEVALVDWPILQALLTGQVEDLLPQVCLQPAPDAAPSTRGDWPPTPGTMTALPVALYPRPLADSLPPPGWTPLRIGLALAWAAVLAALLTVGLGGWALLAFSDRRIRFVSAVTHELRTPLTTLRLYLDMLAGGLVREEKQRAEYLQTLNVEAERLQRLLANVLDFSRLENRRPLLETAPVVLGELLEQIRSAWEGHCRSAGKHLVVENLAGESLSWLADARLVERILGILIDNACKYSRGAADARIILRARRCKEWLVLEVADRGAGVPVQERWAIFRPFRRGRLGNGTAGGVGLGLALASQWARLLGGRLCLAKPGKEPGACFQLELLRKDDARVQAREATFSPPGPADPGPL
jgi:signal transduction histidine kinase